MMAAMQRVVGGWVTVHLLVTGAAGQSCSGPATSDCYDDYTYTGPNGWMCSNWLRRNCANADNIAGYSADEITALLGACPVTCGLCDPPCSDNRNFIDFYGYSCSVWEAYDCTAAQTTYSYTAIQERILIQNCPVSCGVCGDLTDDMCSFPFKYNNHEHSTCVTKDGYRQCLTRSNNWKVCTPQGTPCVFPFIYNGVSYYGCSVAAIGENARQPWCATKVDGDGVAVSGHWTTCPNCNVSDMLATGTCGLGDIVQDDNGEDNRNDGNDMGGGDDNNEGNDMGDGENNEGNDMGDEDNDMGRRRRRRQAFPRHERHRKDVDCDTIGGQYTTVVPHTVDPKFDQADDKDSSPMSFVDHLKANPALMTLFVGSVLIVTALMAGLAYRHYHSGLIIFPKGYAELNVELSSQEGYGT